MVKNIKATTVSGVAGGFIGKATINLRIDCNADTVEEVRQLVEAAPDLFEALNELVWFSFKGAAEKGTTLQQAWENARRAIAKAEGK